ncbi:AAA family ATPase [Marinomonas mediterranea]|uniref:ATP-binding protein n=1 Tax=Marinomonas mediterranea TaxID=119864 RepID=UPI00234B75DB|nr:ATP-binding protein [Marinomonas mediterranea]WCN13974.1 AAA family ATPase [Marinomonas mediterranea]
MINDNVIAYAPDKDQRTALQANAKTLEAYLSWCEVVIRTRMQLYFLEECSHSDIKVHEPPNHHSDWSALATYIRRQDLDFRSQLLLILALVPYVKPQVFDVFLSRNEGTDRPYTEFGCVEYQGMHVATGETLAFLLGGNSVETKLEVQSFLTNKIEKSCVRGDDEHALLSLMTVESERHVNPLKDTLILAPEHVPRFTTGQAYKVALGSDFPAQIIESTLSLEDVYLPEDTLEQLADIKDWVNFGSILQHDWNMKDKIRVGFRALFYGPPGTGKTISVTALGNTLGKNVYKVDLSRVHSKYIGETEKNLEKVFRLAEQNEALLFFDEADAVFGQRTQTTNSNDQYANQHVSYLLQRIERFDGLVVLASNYKENFDDAFFRRFESVVHFSLPNSEQRLRLWKEGFSDKAPLDDDINFNDIAIQYPLSAAHIMNVIRHVSLRSLAKGGIAIRYQDVLNGIEREQGRKVSPRW